MSFEELMKDAEFAAKMEAAESTADIVALLKTKGIETTEEELEKAYDQATNSGEELNEADLENVAGGVSIWTRMRILIDIWIWVWKNGRMVRVRRR